MFLCFFLSFWDPISLKANIYFLCFLSFVWVSADEFSTKICSFFRFSFVWEHWKNRRQEYPFPVIQFMQYHNFVHISSGAYLASFYSKHFRVVYVFFPLFSIPYFQIFFWVRVHLLNLISYFLFPCFLLLSSKLLLGLPLNGERSEAYLPKDMLKWFRFFPVHDIPLRFIYIDLVV